MLGAKNTSACLLPDSVLVTGPLHFSGAYYIDMLHLWDRYCGHSRFTGEILRGTEKFHLFVKARVSIKGFVLKSSSAHRGSRSHSVLCFGSVITQLADSWLACGPLRPQAPEDHDCLPASGLLHCLCAFPNPGPCPHLLGENVTSSYHLSLTANTLTPFEASKT